MQQAKGFTLIELMIVILIIGVIASMAIPNLLSARLAANENNAIATLRAIATAQAQFQSGARADGDMDGTGEFGMLGELSGRAGVRGGTWKISPALLSNAFLFINATGEVGRNGYLFRAFLPDSAGNGLGEVAGGGAPPGIDPELAETMWCVYAWPTDYLSSGVRTFFLSHSGDITFCESESYSGSGNGPDVGAATAAPGSVSSMTGLSATGATGRDGLFWRNVSR